MRKEKIGTDENLENSEIDEIIVQKIFTFLSFLWEKKLPISVIFFAIFSVFTYLENKNLTAENDALKKMVTAGFEIEENEVNEATNFLIKNSGNGSSTDFSETIVRFCSETNECISIPKR